MPRDVKRLFRPVYMELDEKGERFWAYGNPNLRIGRLPASSVYGILAIMEHVRRPFHSSCSWNKFINTSEKFTKSISPCGQRPVEATENHSASNNVLAEQTRQAIIKRLKQ